MDTRALNMAAEFLRDGHEVGRLFAHMCSPTHYTLPVPPVSADARLFALLPHDAVDRLSLLPDALLGNVVSRLPVKDAARTAALSRRWRGVWRSTPLVLVDAHLFPVASAVSRALADHPGPFHCVHFTSSYTEDDFHGLLTSWLQILAGKGIRELVLVNGHRRSPLDFPLPTTILGMATLTRLHLAFWKFPCTAGRPRATCFPNLRELHLCKVLVESRDLDFILDRSPVLEILRLKGNLLKLRLRLVSQSLRFLQLTTSSIEEIFVVDAPRLEKLITSSAYVYCTKVKIGHAPKLHFLGSLHPRLHILELGNTIIKARTRVSPSNMVPSVTNLLMEVHFGVRNDVKMIPSVLRCFPNLETLDIMSAETDQYAGKLNLKFWHESGNIECIQSRIKRLDFRNFQGRRCELTFLKFFFESALVLEEVVILLAADFTSMKEVDSKVESLASMERVSEASSVLVTSCSDPQENYPRSFKGRPDFWVHGPFAN